MTKEEEILKWIAELDQAKKRDEKFRKDGERVLEIYECDDPNKVPFNILFSNTDTLIPALYSAIPIPDVRRRFDDKDPTGKAASEAANRMLSYLIDSNYDGYETFDEAMRNAVIDSLLPGRGVTSIKYDAEIYESGDIDEEGEESKEPEMAKESDLICTDSKEWDSVLFGYCRKWSKLPWLAFEEHIDKAEAKRLFGDEIAEALLYHKDSDTAEDDEESDEKNQGERKTTTIYQIWCKSSRSIKYISKNYKTDYLKVEEDPLELSGFYPIPKPMMFIAKSSGISATAPYLVYERQAKELNRLTVRINMLVDAIKAKGIYDPELGDDLKNLMDGEENEFIPADKSSSIAAEKGFQNAIWFMPIEKMVMVLRELYTAREQCKQVIYEITGISDIIRGSSVASETATAQSIKSQWGTMRLKRNQGEVMRYARDLLRIMLEVAAKRFDDEKWINVTQLPYATDEDLQAAQQIMQMYQQFTSQQPPQQEGQQPQIPEQYQQLVTQAQETLNKPKWSDVLNLLRNDIEKSYRIDIETNSTVMPEATEDKQNANEALEAISRFTGQMYPFVERGNLDFKVFKEMLAGFVRYYKFGAALEGAIDSLVQPPPPPPQPQDNSIQVKQLEIQSKAQSDQAAQQFEIQKLQFEQQAEQGKQALEQQLAQLKLESEQMLESARIESNRIIEQGRASTQIHIEQMRIESQESIAEYNSQINYNLQIELERMRLGIEQVKQDNELQRHIVSEQAATERSDADRELELLKTVSQDKGNDSL
jgi:hypothetical protein